MLDTQMHLHSQHSLPGHAIKVKKKMAPPYWKDSNLRRTPKLWHLRKLFTNYYKGMRLRRRCNKNQIATLLEVNVNAPSCSDSGVYNW